MRCATQSKASSARSLAKVSFYLWILAILNTQQSAPAIVNYFYRPTRSFLMARRVDHPSNTTYSWRALPPGKHSPCRVNTQHHNFITWFEISTGHRFLFWNEPLLLGLGRVWGPLLQVLWWRYVNLSMFWFLFILFYHVSSSKEATKSS